MPTLPDECDWREADLEPVKAYLKQAALDGCFDPDPSVPWDTTPHHVMGCCADCNASDLCSVSVCGSTYTQANSAVIQLSYHGPCARRTLQGGL